MGIYIQIKISYFSTTTMDNIQYNDLSAMPMGSLNSFTVSSVEPTVVQTVKPVLKRERPFCYHLDDPEYKRLKTATPENEQNLWVLKIVKKNREERRTWMSENPLGYMDLNKTPAGNLHNLTCWANERRDLRRLHYSLKNVTKRIPK